MSRPTSGRKHRKDLNGVPVLIHPERPLPMNIPLAPAPTRRASPPTMASIAAAQSVMPSYMATVPAVALSPRQRSPPAAVTLSPRQRSPPAAVTLSPRQRSPPAAVTLSPRQRSPPAAVTLSPRQRSPPAAVPAAAQLRQEVIDYFGAQIDESPTFREKLDSATDEQLELLLRQPRPVGVDRTKFERLTDQTSRDDYPEILNVIANANPTRYLQDQLKDLSKPRALFGYTKKDLVFSIKSAFPDLETVETPKTRGPTQRNVIFRSDIVDGAPDKQLPGFGKQSYMPRRYYEAVYRRLLELEAQESA